MVLIPWILLLWKEAHMRMHVNVLLYPANDGSMIVITPPLRLSSSLSSAYSEASTVCHASPWTRSAPGFLKHSSQPPQHSSQPPQSPSLEPGDHSQRPVDLLTARTTSPILSSPRSNWTAHYRVLGPSTYAHHSVLMSLETPLGVRFILCPFVNFPIRI